MDFRKPIRDMDAIMVRVPDGMKDAITQRAKANGRSMSGEIVAILTDIFEFPDEMALRTLQQQRKELTEAEKQLKRDLDDIQKRLIAVNSEITTRYGDARKEGRKPK